MATQSNHSDAQALSNQVDNLSGDRIPQTRQLHHYGLMVSPTPYLSGTVYAELMPAGQPWYRRLLPWVGNWWYEIHSQRGHHYRFDGGAYTLRGAIFRAMEAVQQAEDEVTDLQPSDKDTNKRPSKAQSSHLTGTSEVKG